jgi:dihydrodipicolinate reductase
MSIKVCIAGTTGWTGSVVARHLLMSDEFEVVGAIARRPPDVTSGRCWVCRRMAWSFVEPLMRC